MRLSAAIIARDEARHIGGCLDSLVDLADEVVVLLDARTRDATAAICAAQI
ncbi:MAG: glycosyltransferase family 2 protein, partial [Oscillochloris sp.]|nr:glycosyltransferase family 2 protein [Oscillochloris sp.]